MGMNTGKVLIIEDEIKVVDFIRQGLVEGGYEAEAALDGQTGLRMATSQNYDLIILDINLPLLNGFSLCSRIRTVNPHVPVLMLTAMGTTDDKLAGFDHGADDYMIKPFEFRELVARIKALMKRAKQQPSSIIRVADLEVDIESKLVKRAG